MAFTSNWSPRADEGSDAYRDEADRVRSVEALPSTVENVRLETPKYRLRIWHDRWAQYTGVRFEYLRDPARGWRTLDEAYVSTMGVNGFRVDEAPAEAVRRLREHRRYYRSLT